MQCKLSNFGLNLIGLKFSFYSCLYMSALCWRFEGALVGAWAELGIKGVLFVAIVLMLYQFY